jgi:hypothetical protein
MPEPDPKDVPKDVYVDPAAPEPARSSVQTGSGTNIGEAQSFAERDDEREKSISSPAGDRTDMSGVGDHGSTTAVPGSTSAPDVMAGGGSTTGAGVPPLPGARQT